jgi:hypothetical protein
VNPHPRSANRSSLPSSASIAAFLGVGTCLVGGARADDTFTVADSTDLAAQVAPMNTPARPIVKRISTSGSLCAQSSVLTDTSYASTNAHVIFGSVLSTGRAPASGSCTVVVELQVAAGFQFTLHQVQWYEFFRGIDTTTAATTSVSYSFEGSAAAPVTTRWTLRNGDDTLTTNAPDLWSPCSASNLVRFRAQLTANLPAATSARGSAVYQINNFDLLTSQLKWRKCGS